MTEMPITFAEHVVRNPSLYSRDTFREAIERINYSSSLLSGQIGTARMAALTPSEMLEIINAKLCESEDDLADWRQRGKVSPGIFHKLVHRFHGLRVMIENNTTK